ncbi:MAG: hypothetical protein AAB693_02670 [Patescibacteria group bacterium]
MKNNLLFLISVSFFISFFVISVTSFPVFVNQVLAREEGIFINIKPENPEPLENVNVSIKSFSVNLDVVSISWFVDGKFIVSEIGKKSIPVRAGAAGSNTSVVAEISFSSGKVEKKVIISPSKIVMLWQAEDSFVPPFYKGKALASQETSIKIVALPEIKSGNELIDPKNMIYKWEKDYENVSAGADYGKNYFLYQNNYLENSENISVTASTLDQKSSAYAGIDVGMVNPKIVFYKKDEKLGNLWEKSVGDGYGVKNNDIIIAAPYFISPKEILSPLLSFSWFINDGLVNIPSYKKHLLNLNTKEGVHGKAKIKLEIENKYKLFQTANKEIGVSF